MKQVRIQRFLVEKEINLRIVCIYGKHRARVYDNGSLIMEIFTDEEREAIEQGGQWIHSNYKVIVHPNSTVEE